MFQVYINTYTHFKINERDTERETESWELFLFSCTSKTNNSFALETLNFHDVGTFFPTKYSFPIINIFGQNTIRYRAATLNIHAHSHRKIYIGCILNATINVITINIL